MTSRTHLARAESEGVGVVQADSMACVAGAVDRRLLDNRNAPCAVGLIKAARLMRELPTGSELEIWSRDRFAPMEIPIFAQRDGYRVEQRADGGRWPMKYFVFIVSKPSDAR